MTLGIGQRRRWRSLAAAGVWLAHLSTSVEIRAQGPSMDYAEYHCEIAQGRPLVVRSVQGRAIRESGDVLPNVEIGVFSEPEHVFRSKTTTDVRGRFLVSGISPGQYRLVARAVGLDTGNVLIHVVSWPRGGVFAARILEVEMRERAIDSCSGFGYAR